MRTTLFVAALALCSCVHSSKFTGPSGEAMVSVRCSGAANDIGDCYNRARQECGGDYQLVNHDERTEYSAQVANGSASVTPVQQREITVRCLGTSAPQTSAP